MGSDCWRAWIQPPAQCRTDFRARGSCTRENLLYPLPATAPVVASWSVKLWMKLWKATQKGSIADRCLKGVTSAARALLEGGRRADGIFLWGLDTSHICPAHRAENVLPGGTLPYQHKWLQKSSEGFRSERKKGEKKTTKKKAFWQLTDARLPQLQVHKIWGKQRVDESGGFPQTTSREQEGSSAIPKSERPPSLPCERQAEGAWAPEADRCASFLAVVIIALWWLFCDLAAPPKFCSLDQAWALHRGPGHEGERRWPADGCGRI